MEQMARNPVPDRSVEYSDNRVSLFAAQRGRCSVTGRPFLSTDEVHCHHIKPVHAGGGDKYQNLTLVRDDVHRLIHATRQDTINAYSNEEKVYQSMMNQIGTGHQCYVVCPLIEESDNDTLSDVDSVETTMQKMTAWFGKFPQVQIEALTGEMKPEQMTAVIDRFAAGQTHILVSTTVVEVGVNVPNATVMLIKNAERFGLAQLHQLRGRVGRSDLQSYCVLLSDKTDNERLNTMTATNDGFEIAQKDLELRGTGQVLGVRQSGFDQCVDDMLKNPELYQSIRALIRRRAQKRLAGPDNA